MLNKEGSASNPFTKEEMNAIMRFGAEDLFAEGGDERAEQNLDGMDLDEVRQAYFGEVIPPADAGLGEGWFMLGFCVPAY